MLLLLLSVTIGFKSYDIAQKDKEFRYWQQTDNIFVILKEGFDYIAQFSRLVGEKIARNNTLDATYIGNTLQKTVGIAKISQEIFTLTLFDFTSPDGHVIASTIEGAIPNPPLVQKEDRSWMEVAPKKPWKLHISSPAQGIVSKEWIIPAGYGITNKAGEFLGSITAGINIGKLTQKIQRSLTSEGANFLLLTSDYKVVTSSSNAIPPEASAFFVQTLSTMPLKEDAARLPKSIRYQNITYHYYRYAYPYPYLILIGDNDYMLDREFKQIVMPQVIQTLALGAFFLVLLYFFRSRIVNPMVKLSGTALALAKGKTDVEIPAMGSVEGNTLADALSQVKDHQKKLADAYAEVEQRVAERTQSLQEALVAKQEFLNNMSHEIRTPVSCVEMRSGVLIDMWEELTEEERKDSALDIRQNCSRLCTLLSNLLDMAAYKAGKLSYNMKRDNIKNVAETVIAECAPLYESKELIVTLETKTNNTMALCDAVRIGQVIRNLLANAIRFTAEGTITLSLYDEDIHYEDGRKVKGLALSICDEGVGIPEKEMFTIFEAFTQSSKTRTGAGGTGLGLAICREIILAHQGTIRAENNQTGKGASFIFVIPVKGE